MTGRQHKNVLNELKKKQKQDTSAKAKKSDGMADQTSYHPKRTINTRNK